MNVKNFWSEFISFLEDYTKDRESCTLGIIVPKKLLPDNIIYNGISKVPNTLDDYCIMSLCINGITCTFTFSGIIKDIYIDPIDIDKPIMFKHYKYSMHIDTTKDNQMTTLPQIMATRRLEPDEVEEFIRQIEKGDEAENGICN